MGCFRGAAGETGAPRGPAHRGLRSPISSTAAAALGAGFGCTTSSAGARLIASAVFGAVPEKDQPLIRLLDILPRKTAEMLAILLALALYGSASKENPMTIKIISNEKGNPPGKLP